MLSFFKNLLGKPAPHVTDALGRGAIIVDVRTAAEYQNGHLKAAQNIPLNNLPASVAMLKKSGKPVIVVCQSGGRSAAATHVLTAAGIEAYNGGAWMNLNNLQA